MEGKDEAASAEQDFRASLEALEMYRAQLDALYQQHELVRLSLEDHSRAAETIRLYAEKGEGEELLVPIGGNSYIFAKVSAPKRAIVGIGSGIRLEEDAEKGLARLDKRVGELRDAEGQLSAKVQELEAYCAALQEKLNRLYAHSDG